MLEFPYFAVCTLYLKFWKEIIGLLRSFKNETLIDEAMASEVFGCVDENEDLLDKPFKEF